jgi:hypothetical protein
MHRGTTLPNEGITTYVTNRIQELLYGVEVAEMETVLSRTQPITP